MADHSSHTPIQQYPGAPLNDENEIRVLLLQPGGYEDQISCELLTTPLASAPAFEALSYAWGDISTCEAIDLQSTEPDKLVKFMVTANCYAALRRLRHTDGPRMLWIDALCIDQTSNPERSHQITLMHEIYSKATQVVIYVGEAADDSDLAIEFIVDCDDPGSEPTPKIARHQERRGAFLGLTQGFESAESGPHGPSPFESKTPLRYTKSMPLLQAMTRFFKRPWFSRVWVLQEVAFSRHASILCGAKTMSWSAIDNFAHWNLSNKWLGELPFVVTLCRKLHLKRNHPLKRSHVGGEPNIFKGISPGDARHCQATDPRDKLYAIRPFLKEEKSNLKPDYSLTPQRVFTDYAVKSIHERGLSFLQDVQGPCNVPGLPSWVPDWTSGSLYFPAVPLDKVNRGNSPRFHWSNVQAVQRERHSLTIVQPDNTLPSDAKTTPYLQIPALHCGTIQNLGSTYIAGQGNLPHKEWSNLVRNEEIKYRKKYATPYYNWLDAFWDVVSMSRLGSSSEGPSCFKSEAWDRMVQELSPSEGIALRDIPFDHAGSHLGPSNKWELQLTLRSSHRRRFFFTDTGYMGMAPQGAEVGDRIYMCVDAHVPFVFRDEEDEKSENVEGRRRVKLIGDCYIDIAAWLDVEKTEQEPEILLVV